MYFSYKIESIWVILALLLNLNKIFSVFRIVIEDGMKNAGFQDCWIGFFRVSNIMSQFMKNSLSQTVILHQIELWQQEHSKQIPSEKGSQPQCLFLHIKHLKCLWQISKACHCVPQSPFSVTGFFMSNMNEFFL